MPSHFLRKKRGQRGPFAHTGRKIDHADRPLKSIGRGMFEDSHGTTYRRKQNGAFTRSV